MLTNRRLGILPFSFPLHSWGLQVKVTLSKRDLTSATAKKILSQFTETEVSEVDLSGNELDDTRFLAPYRFLSSLNLSTVRCIDSNSLFLFGDRFCVVLSIAEPNRVDSDSANLIDSFELIEQPPGSHRWV